MKHKKSTLLWIWKHTKGQAPLLALLSLCSIITSSAYVVPALLCRSLINTATSAASFGEAAPVLLRLGGYLLLVILLQLALSVLNTHLQALIGGKMEISLRQSFFETLLRKSYPQISSLHSGEILNRFTTDVNIVVSGMTNFVPTALSIGAKLIAGLVVVFSFSKRVGIVSIGLGIFVLLGSSLFRPFYKKMHKAVQEASGVYKSFAQECVENMVVIKTFSGRAQILERLSLHMRRLLRVLLRRSIVSNIASHGLSLIFTLVYYGTMVWGAFSIVSGDMDYGTLVAFLQIVSQIQAPFVNASFLITQLYSAMASAERLMEIEDFQDEEIASSPDPVAMYTSLTAICAENLCFQYDKTEVIRNTSFSLPKGSITAITGISGTGKSTLFRLLLGLFAPNEGKLYAKTEKGDLPISSATRPLFAYVPQGNFLLSGTVRENIAFLNPKVTDAEVEEAARTACIYDFIAGLEKGFDTQIGERGSGLSEGQIQRIAVARALCSGAPILLLDECTSALDTQTEEALLRNIAALRTKTVLFISHKNAAFSVCDKHLAIENGVIQDVVGM